ncbi:cache domain-containing sensor histidine kinase [Saccharibacillus alkalitolerans]|uniref:Sensor histidine kinase n=1 Tax=Saccharibacillus alkalitolerans TaxID=2705290 RepID=A0ABX0F7R7_9BACL|nr:sensor histidine kinase [Saccharibacillus alkalitolerans]NGZ76877.1 sensor histidine kinase [Saccharibacillus alkalitolerans]
MKAYWRRFHAQRLFVKLFLVMVVSTVTVCIVTSLVTIRMSERLFTETFGITNSKVLNQIRTGMESFNDSVVNAASYAALNGTIKTYLSGGEGDSVRMASTYYGMNQQMKRVKSNVDAYSVGLTAVGVNGRNYSTDRNYWPVPEDRLVGHPLSQRTEAEPKRLLYQYDEERDETGRSVPYVVASKALMERTTGFIYGDLYISIREDEFRRFYGNFTSAGNDVLILDDSGRIVSSNRTELIGTVSKQLLDYAAPSAENEEVIRRNTDVFGRSSILLSSYIPEYDFYLVNLIDRDYAAGKVVNLRDLVLVGGLIVGAALLLVFLITRRQTRSLTVLVRQMSTVTEKNFDNYVRVTESSGYEVQELSRAYNYMLDELNDYIARLLETQKERRNAELAALQRQINPHFLYNTLASIKILVQKGDKDAAAETINALISLLQNTISNVSETVTIEQELENMRNYVFINHARYGDRIRVNVFASPDCMHYRVPKLIIQPFIENAFFHAFNEKPSGMIYVLVSQSDGKLICEVSDNGDGMDGAQEWTGSDNGAALPNSKSKRQLFTGIGVRNVHNRITLLYGEEYGITIDSRRGEGTKVRIALPLITEET